MAEPFYPLASTTWDEDEYKALERVIKSGNFTMGKEVAQFEEMFAEKTRVGDFFGMMSRGLIITEIIFLSFYYYKKIIED